MHKKRFIDQIINAVGTKFDVYIKNIKNMQESNN